MSKAYNGGAGSDFLFENETAITPSPRACISRRALGMKLKARRRPNTASSAVSSADVIEAQPLRHITQEPEARSQRSSSDKPEKAEKSSGKAEKAVKSSGKTEKSSGKPEKTERSSGKPEKPDKSAEKNEKAKMNSGKTEKEKRHTSSDDEIYEVYSMENEALREEPKKKKKRKGLKVLAIILAVLLFLTAVPVCAFFIMRSRGKKGFEPAIIEVEEVADKIEDVVFYDEGKTLTYRGKKYVYNENVVPIAFIGLDKLSIDDETNMAGIKSSQNDLNMIAVFDTATGEIAIIVIPRDTVVDIDVYDSNGDYLGIQPMQLCLAYPNAMGAGEQACCENALLSYERILCGIDINNFVSLDVSSVGEMADAIGGVDLVSIQTIGDFTEGVEYHLTGDLAREYVRSRSITEFNSDSMRRQRQIQFIKELGKKVYANILTDFGSVADLYSILNEHTYSTINLEKVTYLASSVVQNNSNFSLDNIIVLEGEPALVNGYMEFYPDTQSVFETVLSVFYNEADSAD